MHERRAPDLVFLAILACASVVPYIGGLGFYSDDWATLGLLVNSSDQSLRGLFETLYDSHYKLQMRPTQLAYEALLYKLFGLDPLGYHLVNVAVLASLPLLAYCVLRELRIDRSASLAVSAVYTLLPHYSTDRFWYVAFTYGLSTMGFLASAYALVRAAGSGRMWTWATVGLLALAVAALGMEVVMPLALLLPVAVWWRSRSESLRAQTRPTSSRRLASILLMGSPVVLVGVIGLFKAAVSESAGPPGAFYLVRLIVGSVAFHFGTYGIALPHTLAWSLGQLPYSHLVLAAAMAAAMFMYFARIDPITDGSRGWAPLVLVGCAVFCLATGIFLLTPQIQFWSTGIANRVWIAAALGIALMAVGGSRWVTRGLSGRRRRWAFAALIVLICVSGFVVNTAVSTFWVAAWSRQREVLDRIRQALPVLRPGTTVILDGLCPYVGPAIMFESAWDLRGALQVLYRDSTLQADVTTGAFSITRDGILTRIYDIRMSYAFGHDLILFDVEHRTAVPLVDAGTAQIALASRVSCPEGIPGRGTVALPFDRWFQQAEANGFRPWRRSGLSSGRKTGATSPVVTKRVPGRHRADSSGLSW